MKREQFDALSITERAYVEIGSCALALQQCKWWQTKRKRKLTNLIDLIRSCYNLKPLPFFSHADAPTP